MSQPTRPARWSNLMARMLDSAVDPAAAPGEDDEALDWYCVVPFVVVHLACLAVFAVGWSATAVAVAAGLYLFRMFAITAFYHRYFSHRTFRTSRPAQFLFALAGASAVQRGPLWWAAHHRQHHRHSDDPTDPHSPRQRGFWHSHMVWFLVKRNVATRLQHVKDLARYPELRLVDRFAIVPPLLLGGLLYAAGELLRTWRPDLATDGPQLLVWGLFVSTVCLYHATYTINSLAHRLGTRRFETPDDSRNNWVLAIVTLGEGWHNNHHRHPGAVRQGFAWWEIDLSYMALVALSWLGVVWDLRPVPAAALAAANGRPAAADGPTARAAEAAGSPIP